MVRVVDDAITADALSTQASACFKTLSTSIGFVNLLLLQEPAKPTGLTARYVADDGRKTVLQITLAASEKAADKAP
jgi:hypothetical protein